MVPMAWLVGLKADVWGRKPLLLAGFLILPLRGVLYTLSSDPTGWWPCRCSTVSAPAFRRPVPSDRQDLTQGTGRFNVSLGALSTVFGLGAALSSSLAGFVVQQAGYNAAFLTLAAVAAAALMLLWLAMPETLAKPSFARHTTVA